jgi:hypothetical protein
MMLQLVRSDELPTPPLARNQPLRALVLLVDLLPVPRLLERHLLVRDLEPLLFPHAAAAPEQAGHDPFRAGLLLVKSFFAADDTPVLIDTVAKLVSRDASTL